MATGAGKGGNKGRPATFNPKPAIVGQGPFRHAKPQLPLTGREIPLKPKYVGYVGW